MMPSRAVCRAFGASHEKTRLLAGGQGRTWRWGDLVLKPVDHEDEHAWVCEVFDTWPVDDTVRVPQPVPAPGGSWAFEGWSAHHWVEGADTSARDRPDLIREASDAFHATVSALERPAFLDTRDDPWSFGDRVAWEGLEPQGGPSTLELVRRGLSALRPITSAPQVVHGDIGGNVLDARGLPPAVIDWPPYFRPAGWALAVAAGDAICWGGAPLSLLDAWSDVAEWDQLLLRAVVYRIATRGRNEALGQHQGSGEEYVFQRRPSLDAVLARVSR